MSETFVIKCRFENILSMREHERQYSQEELHGGVPWGVHISKVKDFLSLYLDCNKSQKSDLWTVQTDIEYKIASKTIEWKGADQIAFNNKPEKKIFGWGSIQFMDWDKVTNEFLENGCLNVEVQVKILETEGLERAPLRSFEKNKECSDTTLVVGGRKFHVSKLFLASQSSHFKTLLMGEEPENLPSFKQRLFHKKLYVKSPFMPPTEVTLEDVDPDDFQVFLEVLYGEPAINDDTVRQLLLMSEWFKADTVTRRCEEFLVQKSDKLPKRKFDLALTFDLHKLKKHCVQSFHSISEMRTAIPSDLSRIDREFLEELFRKSLSF